MNIGLIGDIDGGRIGFRTGPAGLNRNRKTVVLVHGAGGNSENFQLLLPLLDREVNAVALDLPGHGQTPGPARSTAGEYARWVDRVLDLWNLSPVLAGHSMGGAVAIELALMRPGGLAGLVLLGSGAWIDVNPALFDGLENDFSGIVEKLNRWCHAKSVDPLILERNLSRWRQNEPATLMSDFQASQFDRREDVGRIDCPTLVVHGDRDKMVPLRNAEYARDHIPGARMRVFAETGHMLAEEQPEGLAEILIGFVRNL